MSRKTIPRETEKPKKLTRAQKKEIPRLFKTSAGLLFLVEKFVVFVNVFYRRQLLGDQGLSLLRQ